MPQKRKYSPVISQEAASESNPETSLDGVFSTSNRPISSSFRPNYCLSMRAEALWMIVSKTKGSTFLIQQRALSRLIDEIDSWINQYINPVAVFIGVNREDLKQEFYLEMLRLLRAMDWSEVVLLERYLCWVVHKFEARLGTHKRLTEGNLLRESFEEWGKRREDDGSKSWRTIQAIKRLRRVPDKEWWESALG